MKKLIDKETLSKIIVWRAYNTEGSCGDCVNCSDTCPIWSSLSDAPEGGGEQPVLGMYNDDPCA